MFRSEFPSQSDTTRGGYVRPPEAGIASRFLQAYDDWCMHGDFVAPDMEGEYDPTAPPRPEVCIQEMQAPLDASFYDGLPGVQA
jgi:hypothetical protein